MSNTTLTNRVSGRMSSRGWAIALGVGAIVLAAVLLVVYLDRYRARVGGANAPTQVLVAKQVIQKGTPGALVASQLMYQAQLLPRKEVDVSCHQRPAVPRRPCSRSHHLPWATAHRRRLRGRIRLVHRVADRRTRARYLDRYRQRPRKPLAGPGGRLRRHLHSGRRRSVPLPPERQGAGDPDDHGPERRGQPRAPHRHEGCGGLRLRSGQHAALVRAPASRGSQADGNQLRRSRNDHARKVGDDANAEPPGHSPASDRARRRRRAGPGVASR